MTLDRSIDLFRELTDDELSAVALAARIRTVEPAEIILRQGVPARAVYILLDGAVRVTAIMDAGDETPGEDEEMLVSLKPGEFFGELSFITGEAPSLSVIAEEPSRLIELEHGALNELIARDAAICRKLLFAITRTLVSRLRSTGRELVLSRYFLRGR